MLHGTKYKYLIINSLSLNNTESWNAWRNARFTSRRSRQKDLVEYSCLKITSEGMLLPKLNWEEYVKHEQWDGTLQSRSDLSSFLNLLFQQTYARNVSLGCIMALSLPELIPIISIFNIQQLWLTNSTVQWSRSWAWCVCANTCTHLNACVCCAVRVHFKSLCLLSYQQRTSTCSLDKNVTKHFTFY